LQGAVVDREGSGTDLKLTFTIEKAGREEIVGDRTKRGHLEYLAKKIEVKRDSRWGGRHGRTPPQKKRTWPDPWLKNQ